MKLSVSWPNATHFLLQNPTVTLEVDGVSVAATMRPGIADFVVPRGSASPPIATLTVSFAPTFTGTATETLRVVQEFELLPPGLFGFGGPRPTSYRVQPAGFAASVTQFGQHPLLQQISSLGLWFVIINTNAVDVTPVQPLLFHLLNKLKRPAPISNVRILARTDGKLPLHWITATPAICTSFANTDILCFLTPPQESPQDRDDIDLLVTASGFAPLAARLAIFLADGVHDNTFPPRGRDHFARAHDPIDGFWRNKPIPSVVLPRGWESALVASGKHVAMVLPVPSGGTHNGTAMATLPALLSDVYAVLVASGDIAAPDGFATGRRPQLGIAAHSNGGGALFSAVAASPGAFQEIWLFDTNDTARNLPALERATRARVLFAGFDPGRVGAPHAAALKLKSLSGRVRRLPDPPLSSTDSPAALAASSSKLTHALEGGGVVVPANSWAPGVVVLSTGETFVERFEVLHQQIVEGNDADGLHYLTKALRTSVFH